MDRTVQREVMIYIVFFSLCYKLFLFIDYIFLLLNLFIMTFLPICRIILNFWMKKRKYFLRSEKAYEKWKYVYHFFLGKTCFKFTSSETSYLIFETDDRKGIWKWITCKRLKFSNVDWESMQEDVKEQRTFGPSLCSGRDTAYWTM